MKNKLLAFSVILLVFSISVVLMPKNFEVYYKSQTKLSEWLPSNSGGWTFVDKPIGETPEMQEAVDELLNFTDGVYRIYSNGDRQLGVYVAYWRPGKMDPRLVAVHSPDVCWVGGGWTSISGVARGDAINTQGKGLLQGELRTFMANGLKQNVLFWHFVGGHPSGYMGKSATSASFWTWSTIVKNPFSPRHEQWFIRLSTDGLLTDFAGDPLWDELLSKLSNISRSSYSN